MKLKLSSIAAAAVLTVALIGCGSDDDDNKSTSGEDTTVGRAVINSSSDSQAKINNVADNVIKKTYATLGTNATALKTSLSGFYANVDAAKVEAARKAWKAVRAPWESSEAYIVATSPSVGSATDGNTDSWPVSKATDIAEGLKNWKGDTLTIQTADGEVKGFHTIEYYLFGDGTAVETAANAATRLNNNTNAQGKYLKALGSAFEHDMLGLTSIWTDEDDKTTDDDETGSAITAFKALNKADAASALMQGVIDISTEVGDGKIADPLGEDGAIDTTKVESQFSWNSSSDFYNNIYSIKKVWTSGLKELATIAAVPATKTQAVDAAIESALLSIKNISDLDTAKVIAGIEVISQENAFRNKLTSDKASIVNAQMKVKALTVTLEAVQKDLNK